MEERAKQAKANEQLKTYALISHESAVEAIWALAARGWKETLDDEDIWLVPAAESCVKTQGEVAQLQEEVDLKSLGIQHMPIDLLVPNKSCYSRGKRATFHVWQEFFPPRSFVRVHDRVLVSTPYYAALQLAMSRRSNRLSRAEAEESASVDARMRAELGIEERASTAEELMRWDNIARLARATQVLCDFMGTYRYVPINKDGSRKTDVVFGTKPIIEPVVITGYLEEMGAARGIRRARRAMQLAFANAASPMETLLALILTLPQQMGGFGLPRPVLNEEIPIEPLQRELSSQDTIVADLCWGKQKVIVEYYGWDEHFGAGPRKVASDAARVNSITALGWTVFHATFEQVKTLAGITLLAQQVAHALGCQLSTPSDLELVWRARLLMLLLPDVSHSLS